MAGFGTDFIGFLFDKTGNAYYFPLSLVAILSGVLYGIFLYRKNVGATKFVVLVGISRVIVVLVCNLCLNSYFIYTGFINKNFQLFSSDGWNSFFTWLLVTQRITKNVIQLPIDVVLMCILLPIAYLAFKRVRKSYVR